jgi:hypothetical protein
MNEKQYLKQLYKKRKEETLKEYFERIIYISYSSGIRVKKE